MADGKTYGIYRYGSGTADECVAAYRFDTEADAKRWAQWSAMLGDLRSYAEVATEDEAREAVPEAFDEGARWEPRTVMGAVKAWECTLG